MRKLKVIMLCDTEGPAHAGKDIKVFLKKRDWVTERNCYEALCALGHEVRIMGMYDNIKPFVEEVWADKPDIVFNLVENFDGQSFYERNIVGLFELLKVPYTGSNPAAIVLSKNKALTKELLSHHKINVSRFKVYYRQKRIIRPKWITFPAIVKPLREEASIGISKASLVTADNEFKDRIKFIHDNMMQDAIVEEYIEGRELYVSIMGNKSLTTFPIRELYLPSEPNGPQFATYKVKWDPEYRKRWKVRYAFAKIKDKKLEEQILNIAKRAYRVLRIQGYARLDMRLTPDGEIYIIEANPNPGITKREDFSLSAKKGGLEFNDMIARILSLGLEYHDGESIQE